MRYGFLIVGLLLLPVESLRAQVPRADFTPDALRAVSEVTGTWKRAWEDDAAGEVAELLSEDAVLVLPGGERIEGRDRIESVLGERILPSTGEVATLQLELVSSGRMAVTSGRFQYEREVDGELSEVSGQYVMVLLRDGRHWRIRSQLFSEDDAGFGF